MKHPEKPDIASGTVVPNVVAESELKKLQAKEEPRQQRIHDFLIATYGIIGGLVSGVISSLIVLWLQGLL